MSRILNTKKFEEIFQNFIVNGKLNEIPSYYKIYKKRYFTLLTKYAELVDESKKNVLDIGGGQYALLCKKLWEDNSYVIDVVDNNFPYLKQNELKVIKKNLTFDNLDIQERFDVIFFSEVIEHIPIPGHLVIQKLKKLLKPGGFIICTTPNLYRLRNVIFLAMGKNIFDYFRYSDGSIGHILEYSKDHLVWQFREAGFTDINVEVLQLHNSRTKIIHRILAYIGSPIYFIIPRFRDHLLLIAKNK